MRASAVAATSGFASVEVVVVDVVVVVAFVAGSGGTSEEKVDVVSCEQTCLQIRLYAPPPQPAPT